MTNVRPAQTLTGAARTGANPAAVAPHVSVSEELR
jgi:hypothetical protein